MPRICSEVRVPTEEVVMTYAKILTGSAELSRVMHGMDQPYRNSDIQRIKDTASAT